MDHGYHWVRNIYSVVTEYFDMEGSISIHFEYEFAYQHIWTIPRE